jgi:hypothetical protein
MQSVPGATLALLAFAIFSHLLVPDALRAQDD